MSKIIGIDLGTTKSCVAVFENGKPVILKNSEGYQTTPSIVAFLESGEIIVGDVAKKQAITNPLNTIMNIKRFMGKNESEVIDEIKNNSYKIVKDADSNVFVEISKQKYRPQMISALILQKLKLAAEEHLNHEVTEAVIAVPAYFNNAQRQATKEAGEIAGLNVRRIINEPTAAALAYNLGRQRGCKIAVFDLGGGTFDISILETGDGVFEVKSTNGDTHLGGNDFDKVIMDWLTEEFIKDEGVNLLKDSTAWQRLKDCAEKAKIELSSSNEVEINLPCIAQKNEEWKHLTKKLTRTHFEKLSDQIFQRCINICQQAVEEAGLLKSNMDEIIMIGESSRIPKVLDLVERFFGKKLNLGVNFVEAVALGAAIQGAILSGDEKDILLLDLTSLSFGIETVGGVMSTLIGRNTTIPAKNSEIYTTTIDGQSSVNIHVLQGENKTSSQNKSLGRFSLDGILPNSQDTPHIEVCFDIDVNGILTVSAKNQTSGRGINVRIEGGNNLSPEELNELKSLIRKNEIRIKTKRINDTVTGISENLIFKTTTILLNDQLDSDCKNDIKIALEKLIKAHKIKHVVAMRITNEELNAILERCNLLN